MQIRVIAILGKWEMSFWFGSVTPFLGWTRSFRTGGSPWRNRSCGECHSAYYQVRNRSLKISGKIKAVYEMSMNIKIVYQQNCNVIHCSLIMYPCFYFEGCNRNAGTVRIRTGELLFTRQALWIDQLILSAAFIDCKLSLQYSIVSLQVGGFTGCCIFNLSSGYFALFLISGAHWRIRQ